jgi:hypothetical protein
VGSEENAVPENQAYSQKGEDTRLSNFIRGKEWIAGEELAPFIQRPWLWQPARCVHKRGSWKYGRDAGERTTIPP